MSNMASPDGSEDVNDFLQRIKELGDKRDKEDEERNRKLEEEILQGRKERQARRAERARSLSPTKDSPSNAGTPQSSRSIMATPTNDKVNRPQPDPEPSAGTMSRDSAVSATLDSLTGPKIGDNSEQSTSLPTRDLPDIPKKPQISPRSSPSAALPPSRAGTLSWQRRPNSQALNDSKSRPLSALATDRGTEQLPRATPEPSFADDIEVSRSQIAQSLSSKDPSWFKQTADRGLGSAAFRRNQDIASIDHGEPGVKMPLPGLSRESAAVPEHLRSPPPESERSNSPSRASSFRDSATGSNRYSSNSSVSGLGNSEARSPLPTMTSQRFEPPTSDTISSNGSEQHSLGRNLTKSPAQGRISPERLERPPSPTKGLGGFVQSAMLKRSDSVTKRWSTQAAPGLSRGNSIASNRSGYGGSRDSLASLAGSMSPPKLDFRPHSFSRDNSPSPVSRPASSHSNITVTQGHGENERPNASESGRCGTGSPLNDELTRSTILSKDRTSSTAVSQVQHSPTKVNIQTSPPASPSKTMDPKRWSPTKASWLESALNKPEAPKPKVPPPQQPSWMVDRTKTKQQRGDVERSGSPENISIGGLIRPIPSGGPEKPLDNRVSPHVLDSTAQGRSESDDRIAKDAKQTATPLPKPQSTDLVSGKSQRENSDKSALSTEPRQDSLGRSDSHLAIPSRTESDSTKLGRSSPAREKGKPETPPKKDFRAALKPRQQIPDTGPKIEPEFKNVFGKLKRTQTQNYVAPDVLKSKILRGKAGLSVTDGPQKSERQDELKQSLIKQKEVIKAKASADGPQRPVKPANASENFKVSSPPQATAKKHGLASSDSPSSKPNYETDKSSAIPEAIARQNLLRDTPKLGPQTKQSAVQNPIGNLPPNNGRLTDRLNPALAGLLARKASPVPSINPTEEVTSQLVSPGLTKEENDFGVLAPDAVPQLKHMTKNRARGPRRRLPNTKDDRVIGQNLRSPSSTSVRTSPDVAKIAAEKSGSRPSFSLEDSNVKTPSKSKPITPVKKAGLTDTAARPTEQRNTPPKPTPTVYNKSPGSNSNPALEDQQKQQSPRPSRLTQEPRQLPPLPRKVTPTTPKKHDTRSRADQSLLQSVTSSTSSDGPSCEEREADEPVRSVKDALALWGRSSDIYSSETSPSQTSIRIPSRKDEELPKNRVSSQKSEKVGSVGLGLEASFNKLSHEGPLDKNLPSPKSPPINSAAPPVPAKNSTRLSSKNFLISQSTSSGSPIPQTSEAFRLFEEFFDEAPTATGTTEVDTQAVLSSKVEDAPKIKTLRKQIWEVTGDGKRTAVPSHQEHILFEDYMYLCTHIFGSSNGIRTTETYLWIGCNVSDSAVEDAQLFSRKAAKDNNSKLTLLKQGRETAGFFQALGGIVITRCGSRSRVDSPYMLCGRRYVGQIAFDEVELSPSRLCSGFPYIVSSLAGKLYLWKGKGSSAEELGCARLIGMDLGLSGEIEEIDEGHEPSNFLTIFAPSIDNSIPKSADYWRLKASYDHTYRTRVFRIDHETPSKLSALWSRRPSTPNSSSGVQIREIAPFCQTDLLPENVYVVDAFFEIYILLGGKAQSKFAEFQTALVFAQEYGILAASMEDRPFVPVSTVVLHGIPRDLKAVFRKWDEKRTLTAPHSDKSPTLRVVPLSAAIAATRR